METACTPESAKLALWRYGIALWKLHPGQLVIEEAFQGSQGKSLSFACEASRQLGKSFWAVYKADETARQIPGCQIRFATAYYDDIRNIVYPNFRELLKECPESLRPLLKEHDGRIEYPQYGGSTIQLVGLDRNPDKLRGTRIRLFVFEEAGFCDSDALAYAYRSVVIPATTHEPEARAIFISTPPPQGNEHAFCQFADSARLDGAYVKLTVYDNPTLSADRIEKLAKEVGGKESIAFRREYLCERIIDETRAIIPEFKPAKHVGTFTRDDAHHFYHRYVALDSGVRDQTALIFGHYHFPSATLVIEDEAVLQGQNVTTRAIAEIIRGKEKELWPKMPEPYLRIADNDNLILVQDLGMEFGTSFLATGKDELAAMVNKVRLWFQSGRIKIHPRCLHLIGCLGSALWDKHRVRFDRSPRYGHQDILAALIYMVRNVDEVTNPVPKIFAKSHEQVWDTAPWRPVTQEEVDEMRLEEIYGE